MLFAILAVAFGVLLHATPFGRSIYAIGANEEAAYFSGLRVKRIKLILFVLSGTVAALAGIVISLRNSTAAANVGQGFELTAITAVLLGGVSIFGGRGTLVGVIARAVPARRHPEGAAAQRVDLVVLDPDRDRDAAGRLGAGPECRPSRHGGAAPPVIPTP